MNSPSIPQPDDDSAPSAPEAVSGVDILQRLVEVEIAAQANRDAVLVQLQSLAGEGQVNRDLLIQQLQALETGAQENRDALLSNLQHLAGAGQTNRDALLSQLQQIGGEGQTNRDLLLRQLQTLEAATQSGRDTILSLLHSGQKNSQAYARDLMLGLERVEKRLARWEEGSAAARDQLTAAVLRMGRQLHLRTDTAAPREDVAGHARVNAEAPLTGKLAKHPSVLRIQSANGGRVFASLDRAGLSATLLLDALMGLKIAPGTPVACIFRPTPDDDSEEQARQIFGVIGKAERVDLTEDAGGVIAIATGKARAARALFSVVWREEDFQAAQEAHEWTARWGETFCPIIALPDDLHLVTAAWMSRAAAVVAKQHKGVSCFGLAWPRVALRDIDGATALADLAKRAMEKLGGRFVFQFVRGAVTPADSAAILKLARQTGAAVDLTVLARGESGPYLWAYQDLCAYRPSGFDIRLIDRTSLTTKGATPVCVARRQISDGDAHAGRGAFAIRSTKARIERRLDVVVDRAATQRARERVRREPVSGQGLWEQHMFFNWGPPTGDWAFAFVVEANEMSDPQGPALLALQELEAQGSLTGPREFLQHAEASARELGALNTADNVDLQVSVHAYLRDQRNEPSPDSAYIATWLPQKLGRTLELGAGYGALARLVISRASTYAALDLTQEQADALTEIGATGVVGDIHKIPFPDASFDTLLADNVIEHASDPVQALREIARVLAPDGHAYLVMPLDYFTSDFENASHHWKADETSIRAAIAHAGLETRRVRTAHLSEFGMEAGSNPSCGGFTSFWELVRIPSGR